MHWRIKGILQKVLGVAPYGARLHHALQRSLGGLSAFGAECDSKVEDFGLMLGHLRDQGQPVKDARLVEIGSGWYPTFPVCLHLLGAAKVYSFDLNRHLDSELLAAMVQRLEQHLPTLATLGQVALPELRLRHQAFAAAIARGESLADASGGCIVYQAPADATATGLPEASVDVVFSNSVLEHVPGPVIEQLFAEARRILTPAGAMFHSVNCGDHYAYFDRKINQLHYLSYSAAQWAFWNNAFLYQNRLRARDFTAMAEGQGFAIALDTSVARPARLQQLDAMTVSPEFAHYPREQLAITSIDFIARPGAGAALASVAGRSTHQPSRAIA